MSVIQKIQEKYAKLMAVVIAVALIMFVLMLAFENGGSLFSGGPGNTVGKINGQAIGYEDFSKKIDQVEFSLKQQGYPDGAFVRQQAMEQAWNQEIVQALMKTETGKLGMRIGKKELGDILYGENPPADIRQGFTDPQTGVFNPQAAKQAVDQQLKNATPEQKAGLNQYFEQLEQYRLSEKYSALLSSSINFPKWLIENENADNSQIANAAVIREFYTSIPDTAVSVSDKEILDYINKRKDEFKQQESRSISYVAFSALPTAADSVATLQSVTDLKPEFDTITSVADFIMRNNSSIPYGELYLSKTQLQQANQQMQAYNKDTIFSLGKGQVYGPYLDGSSYVLAKMIDSKILPDSVKCRHILLGTIDRQGQPIMADSTAKRKADSVYAAIQNGASFNELEELYSTDEAAGQDKGVMTFSSTTIQSEGFAKEFGQFILFDGKPGSRKVVKTDFGYHYIEVMEFIKPQIHYNVAYMSRPIEASVETDRMASNEATVFASESRNQKEFDASAEKLKAKGINKMFATDITPIASQVMGLGDSRSFVRNIYEADLGEVLEPERVGDNYVVAMVTEINKKGTMSASRARMMVEPALRNEKKAELIKAKIGAVTTLEEVAAKLGKTIETADSIRMKGAPAPVIGPESKVIGAIFNPANRGKVVPEAIAGSSGVYVVRVNAVSATPVADANVAEQRQARYQQYKMRGAYPQQALMEAADIKDNRRKFF